MSRVLAWSFGASVGYLVGWLAGQSTRDALALRSLSRPGPRTGLSASTETPEPAIGPQNGVQQCGKARP